MATSPTKLSDIFKGLAPRNPASPFVGAGAAPSPFMFASSNPAPIAPGVPTSQVVRTLPNGQGSYASPVIAQPTAPAAPSPAPVIPPPPAPAAASAAAPVVAPGGVDYSRYTDPATGRVLSPQEYANMLATRIQGGSIPNYAGNAITQGPQTTAQLTSTATDLNNERNDMAVGATDPYKVASKSGVAYSPTDLAAIEKAYAGIYDPAIKDVFAKLETKQKEDASALEQKNKLAQMAKQHEYDVALKSIGTSGSSNQMTDNERAAQTLFQNNPIVKDYNTVVNQKNTIDKLVQNGVGGPGDVATIFTFMKALDPTSVVRESEYDKAAASGNLFQGIWARFNGYFKDKGGILPENVRLEFQNLINQKLAAQGMSYNNLADRTREIAKRQGMNPDNVVIDFSGAVTGPTGLLVTAPDNTQVEIID